MKPKKNNKGKQVTKEQEYLKLQELVTSYDWSKFDSFDDIPISERTKIGLKKSGYTAPTDIQQQSIGYALCGNDILGAAKTGSGKTLAFLVPMLECLYKNQWTPLDGLGALIISPTRELSYQIFEVLNKVGAKHDFSAGLVIGGKDLKFETKRMDRCNIIVCTPGRLLQHMDENPLFTCYNLKMLILDEADRILDLGFAKTMNAIIANLPTERQTLLFSATQTKSVKDLARLSLKDPVYVSSHEHEKHCTPENLSQSYIVCPLENKINLLWSFIKQHSKQKMIVFMSSCKQVKFVYDLFCRLRPGIPLLALYGTLHQMKRMSIYDKFCSTSRTVLFATDIASRGLDFPSVNWVVQLDCPENVNTYIHRVGRTARFEKGGESLLVLLPSEEKSMIQLLSEKKVPIEKIAVNPKKMNSIQRKTEALLARDVALKEIAQRAFKAYLKNVFLMKDKNVFQLETLNLDEFARSLGLAITPRVRFIERKLAADGKSLQNNNKSVKSTSVLHGLTDGDYHVNKDKSIQLDIASDEEDCNDLFQVKKVWRYDQEDGSQDNDVAVSLAETLERKKASKTVSKASVVKRLLKKNIKLNTKIVFDEDGGKQVFSGGVKQASSQFTDELADTAESGINIEVSKKIMEQEDKVDKEAYRQLLRERNREKKLKLKAQKQQKGAAELATEDDKDEMTDLYIDALPDPDRIYQKEEGDEANSDQQSYNDAEDDDESEASDSNWSKPASVSGKPISKNAKRKALPIESDSSDGESSDQSEVHAKSSKKQKRAHELNYFENVALKLLQNH